MTTEQIIDQRLQTLPLQKTAGVGTFLKGVLSPAGRGSAKYARKGADKATAFVRDSIPGVNPDYGTHGRLRNQLTLAGGAGVGTTGALAALTHPGRQKSKQLEELSRKNSQLSEDLRNRKESSTELSQEKSQLADSLHDYRNAIAGTGAGALLGTLLGGQDNRMLGGLLGGTAGGAAGYYAPELSEIVKKLYESVQAKVQG